MKKKEVVFGFSCLLFVFRWRFFVFSDISCKVTEMALMYCISSDRIFIVTHSLSLPSSWLVMVMMIISEQTNDSDSLSLSSHVHFGTMKMNNILLFFFFNDNKPRCPQFAAEFRESSSSKEQQSLPRWRCSHCDHH
jgi:hypothetical protein